MKNKIIKKELTLGKKIKTLIGKELSLVVGGGKKPATSSNKRTTSCTGCGV